MCWVLIEVCVVSCCMCFWDEISEWTDGRAWLALRNIRDMKGLQSG